MKAKIYASALTIISTLILISFFSCNHQKEQDAVSPATSGQVNTGTPPRKTNAETICCSANCQGGSCTASKQVCNCACNIDGTPNCSGGGTAITQIVEGDYTVTATTDQLGFQNRLVNYFQTSQNSHASDVYSLAYNRYKLFVDNNGRITSTSGLQSYYTYSRQIQCLLIQYFSSQEIQDIQNL